MKVKAILKEIIHSTWWSAAQGQKLVGEIINGGSHFRYRYDKHHGSVEIPVEKIEILC